MQPSLACSMAAGLDLSLIVPQVRALPISQMYLHCQITRLSFPDQVASVEVNEVLCMCCRYASVSRRLCAIWLIELLEANKWEEYSRNSHDSHMPDWLSASWRTLSHHLQLTGTLGSQPTSLCRLVNSTQYQLPIFYCTLRNGSWSGPVPACVGDSPG